MLRLLTYNIHGCIGHRGRLDPDAVLDVVAGADADLVALQEVYAEDDADRNFLHALECRLDYHEVIYGSTMRKASAHYGNVLMSRLPLREQERIDLSVPGREPRGAIRAALDFEGRAVEVVATHLGLAPAERREQVRRLAASAAPGRGAGAVSILLGDLNEWFPFSRANRRLRRLFGPSRRVPTFPAWWPLFALDRVHVWPEDLAVRTRALRDPRARRASDHLPLLAEIDWPETGAGAQPTPTIR